EDWLHHARRSPVYPLAHPYRGALPLHPEYRPRPTVWYGPPLSPVVHSLGTDGYEADPDHVFGAIDQLPVPLAYLGNLLAAGDGEVIRDVLRRLAAMRGYMRKREVLGEPDHEMVQAAGMTTDDVEDMYRLLAIGKYDERYVVPKAHAELGERLMQQQGTCGLDFEGGPGNCGMVGAGGDGVEAGAEGFMLSGDGAVTLDIVKMAEHPHQ